jgi:GNAT superfamily N-acetyltransferase
MLIRRATKADESRVLSAALLSTVPDPIVLVVGASTDEIAGFIHLHSAIDYYTERPHGHVADIVVAAEYEGQGVARLLLAAAKDWARENNYEWLTISVFEQNLHAAQLYERVGFRREILRMIMPLEDSATP